MHCSNLLMESHAEAGTFSLTFTHKAHSPFVYIRGGEPETLLAESGRDAQTLSLPSSIHLKLSRY